MFQKSFPVLVVLLGVSVASAQDKVTIPLSSPAQPVTVKVHLMQGSINVVAGSAGQVVVESGKAFYHLVFGSRVVSQLSVWSVIFALALVAALVLAFLEWRDKGRENLPAFFGRSIGWLACARQRTDMSIERAYHCCLTLGT